MQITPTLEEVKPFAECGKYDVMPLSCALLSDALTPIQALRILRSVSDHCYILESLSDADSYTDADQGSRSVQGSGPDAL